MAEFTDPITLGSPSQNGYAYALLKRLPGANALDVVREVLGEIPSGNAVSIADASKVIGHLEQKLGVAGRARRGAAPGGKRLTSYELRRIAQNQAPWPDQLDEDSRWILEALEKMDLITELVTGDVRGKNRGGPMLMSDLVEHFGSWDHLAAAFNVTTPSAKAWGEALPANRMYEAEVKTNRRFRAPR